MSKTIRLIQRVEPTAELIARLRLRVTSMEDAIPEHTRLNEQLAEQVEELTRVVRDLQDRAARH